MAILIGRAIGAALLGAWLLAPPAAAQEPEPGADAVKSAFLYNFTKFVDWPEAAFPPGAAPFRVCVFAHAALRAQVEGMLAGEAVGGRPVRVVTPAPAEARGCHIAYFAAGEADKNAAQVLTAVRGQPILLVGEGAAFLAQGGHISFIVESNRVRFDVNRGAIDRSGLTISSKLLRVARKVQAGGRQS